MRKDTVSKTSVYISFRRSLKTWDFDDFQAVIISNKFSSTVVEERVRDNITENRDLTAEAHSQSATR